MVHRVANVSSVDSVGYEDQTHRRHVCTSPSVSSEPPLELRPTTLTRSPAIYAPSPCLLSPHTMLQNNAAISLKWQLLTCCAVVANAYVLLDVVLSDFNIRGCRISAGGLLMCIPAVAHSSLELSDERLSIITAAYETYILSTPAIILTRPMTCQEFNRLLRPSRYSGGGCRPPWCLDLFPRNIHSLGPGLGWSSAHHFFFVWQCYPF